MLHTPRSRTPLWLKQDCRPHPAVREAAKGGPIAGLCAQATGWRMLFLKQKSGRMCTNEQLALCHQGILSNAFSFESGA